MVKRVYDRDEYKKILKEKLSEKRYKHCINVAKTSICLAKKFGGDIEKAEIAGLLHDITKEDSAEKQLGVIEEFGEEITDLELKTEKLWHAISGSIFIKEKLGIKDQDIINAVRYHTIARGNMSVLEKIIFIADFISEDRKYDELGKIRAAAEIGIDEAMAEGTRFYIRNLLKNNRGINLCTVEAYNKAVLDLKKRCDKMTNLEIVKKSVEALEDKKGEDISVIKVEKKSSIADYVILTTGKNSPHVKALADEVELRLKQCEVFPGHIEGYKSNNWILMDYKDVIINVFSSEARNFYKLDELLNQGEIIEL